jgi:hypothetical protein
MSLVSSVGLLCRYATIKARRDTVLPVPEAHFIILQSTVQSKTKISLIDRFFCKAKVLVKEVHSF